MKFGRISVERQGDELVIARDGMALGKSGTGWDADLRRALRFAAWYVAHTRRLTRLICYPHTARWAERLARRVPGMVGGMATDGTGYGSWVIDRGDEK